MSDAALDVNGRTVAADAPPRRHLGDWLREDLRLTGLHLGCEHGVCGACTVEIDGAPARACIAFPAALAGARIRTIEAFDDDAVMASLRRAFSEEHALQCGFCTPGMLIAARDAVLRAPGPDEAWIRREMAGNLCRCTGYVGIVRAIVRVVTERQETGLALPPSPPTAPATIRVRRSFVPREAADPAPPAPAGGAVPRDMAPRDMAPRDMATRDMATRDMAPRDMATSDATGWSRVEAHFIVARQPDATWAALADFPLLARCFPGATLTGHGADRVTGEVEVGLGPIRATFRGAATVERDEGLRTGVVSGAGQDGRSASRTRAEIAYRLTPDGPDGTRVDLDVAYRLTGPLAQFSRAGIVRSLARALVADFARRLNAELAGRDGTAPPSRPASAIRRALARLVPRRRRR
ncbi:hypothetical protein OPKNFCMD_1404 [Methylobacterium crusticola]|uniref:2Fe-2S ferredoxin-type domain-containing protein n=1 Tax=Methylobacterium crusticola TaxID=1697972 RepID=A0ABQ4QVJ4_9HYPH|nr:2Fe-2S iron-sulfur cluster-binding protein [Methylobacterium crusticola]GJD48681.1 hypothetical protein OPKNFCMD_1404 [Methylobacterium crusticola]